MKKFWSAGLFVFVLSAAHAGCGRSDLDEVLTPTSSVTTGVAGNGSGAGVPGTTGSGSGVAGTSGPGAGTVGVAGATGNTGAAGATTGRAGSVGTSTGAPGSSGANTGSAGASGTSTGRAGSSGASTGSAGTPGTTTGGAGTTGTSTGRAGTGGGVAGAPGTAGSGVAGTGGGAAGMSGVTCGLESCVPGQTCCVQSVGGNRVQMCIGPNEPCQGGGNVGCTAGTCGGDRICCLSLVGMATACASPAECTDGVSTILCSSNADCPSDRRFCCAAIGINICRNYGCPRTN